MTSEATSPGRPPRRRLRSIVRATTLILLLVSFLALRTDILDLNPAQRVALPYRYSILQWEARNLLSKWLHRLVEFLPGQAASDERSQVLEYFRLVGEIDTVGSQLSQAAAQAPEITAGPAMALDARLALLKKRRDALRNDVEETLEGAISGALAENGLATWGPFTFPPVDIRLTDPARLLVTSRRDRIERLHDVLLIPTVGIDESELIERELMDEWDLAGLVTEIGGLATYPASVGARPLKRTLQIAAHEWVHNYLTVRLTALGLNINKTPEMLSLNETVADIVGRELGERAFDLLDLTPEPQPPAPSGPDASIEEPGRAPFDFGDEMRETRRRVDELLAAGEVEEAEAYMEARREVFVSNGFYIRKLNQAYFAFNGTYAESQTSVSPIGEQLHELRELSPDLKAFFTTMAGFSSYERFLDELARRRIGTAR